MIHRNLCETCGGTLERIDETHYVCECCGNMYSAERVEDYVCKMKERLDDAKLEMISTARKNLYNAVTAKYISSEEIHECCIEIKKYLPDDFQANFYDGVVSKTRQEVAKMIRKIDVKKDFDCLETIIKFLICSLEIEFVIATKDLIERAYYRSDKEKYYKYTSAVENEAEKLDNFIYSTTYPRKAFVAYSSKDSEKAMELVETLEAQGISCFISIRNLRHGAGSRENYDKSLKEAMDNCTSFVFVSSMNSRNAACDALTIEIPYVMQNDKNNAPGNLRNYYSKIPSEYKKPRVEYRIQESVNENAADELVDEFFDGYERVYTANDVARRVLRQSVGVDVHFAADNVAADNSTQIRKNEKKAPAIIPSDERNKRGRTIGILSVVAIILILTILFVWVVPLVRNNHSDNSNNNNNNTESINVANKNTDNADNTDKSTVKSTDSADDTDKITDNTDKSTDNTEDNTDNSTSRVGEKITFGSYPQTKVTEASLTATLNTKAGSLPESDNSQAWTSYGYYIDGKVENFMWYIDVEEGSEKYRGVYFTSYRPDHTMKIPLAKDETYQYDNGYTTSIVYWFKYEPISWTILSENTTDGTALILCDMTIDSQAYQNECEYDSNSRKCYNTLSGVPSGTYANNYAHSTIRKWLNETFYNTAFSELQKQIILTTTVDNSVASTGYSSNSYACENTEDKIFLLSAQQVTNTAYGFASSTSTYDTVRRKKTTDYAQAQGAYTSTSTDHAGYAVCWWLRSPDDGDSSAAHGVVSDGRVGIGYMVYDAAGGVVPALQIKLFELN